MNPTAFPENVIGYRRLGKANYHFSAEAYRFALAHQPCIIICFDISGFFDNLDHALLKKRLRELLGVSELSGDWYKVFRHVTKYRSVELSDLRSNTTIVLALKSRIIECWLPSRN